MRYPFFGSITFWWVAFFFHGYMVGKVIFFERILFFLSDLSNLINHYNLNLIYLMKIEVILNKFQDKINKIGFQGS